MIPELGMPLQALATLMQATKPAPEQADVQVRGVQHDSRQVQPGDIFVAIAGAQHDGHAYINEALQRGAVAVVSEKPMASALLIPLWQVPSARVALARIAQAVYGDPTQHMPTLGITGTNGKTTVAWLLESILQRAGERPALLSTITRRGPAGDFAAAHTTPESDDMMRFARSMLEHDASHLVMEVSSHALAMHRVDACRFRVAAFTNLSHDHLDFHGSMAAYQESKARLFRELSPQHAVLNIDDAFGRSLAEEIAHDSQLQCWTCSVQDKSAQVYLEQHVSSGTGVELRWQTPAGPVQSHTTLLGRHNLENLNIALASALALGIDREPIAQAFSAFAGVPGRLQAVPSSSEQQHGHPKVFVDYAHTPEALRQVLLALRPITSGRLIVVFGCGGDRDADKRPIMGEIALSHADIALLTNDNPRSESPAAILDHIALGARRAGAVEVTAADLAESKEGQPCFLRLAERDEAILSAIRYAGPDDTVLIAGKGHEAEQLEGSQRRAFDDREHAAMALRARRVA